LGGVGVVLLALVALLFFVDVDHFRARLSSAGVSLLRPPRPAEDHGRQPQVGGAAAVLRRFIGEPPVLNPRYLDFARHAGFTIVPCNLGKDNEKGRVESGVGYGRKYDS